MRGIPKLREVLRPSLVGFETLWLGIVLSLRKRGPCGILQGPLLGSDSRPRQEWGVTEVGQVPSSRVTHRDHSLASVHTLVRIRTGTWPGQRPPGEALQTGLRLSPASTPSKSRHRRTTSLGIRDTPESQTCSPRRGDGW